MRHRPYVVVVTWPDGSTKTLGFKEQYKAERYLDEARERGAVEGFLWVQDVLFAEPARDPRYDIPY